MKLKMKSCQSIWKAALNEIKKSGTAQTSFDLWFSPLKAVAIQDDTFTIAAPTPVIENVISHMYMDLIKNAVLVASGKEFEIKIILEDKETKEEPAEIYAQESSSTPEVEALDTYTMPFNPRYTFDEFIVGPNNEFAYGTALGAVNKPSTVYNPLLIYGGTGLGKTHLLQAIGTELKKIHPDWRITYITSERFTTDLVESLHKKTNIEFRETYRNNVDVLLIDDIQFFAGKDRSQEEFFHTFNELINKGKRIILTSDRPPKDIYPLEERIRTRIESGMMADIQPPDYETRLAILHKKLESAEYSADIPEDVMEMIATQVNTNIRELEGAIKKLVAYKEISRKDIDMDLAVTVLKDIISDIHTNQIDAKRIITEVENYFNLSSNTLISKRRDKSVVFPRQLAMFICRQLTDLSSPQLGKEFNRDHSTILSNIKNIEEAMQTDLHVQYEINELIKKIKGM